VAQLDDFAFHQVHLLGVLSGIDRPRITSAVRRV
jgi:hypothetical protein